MTPKMIALLLSGALLGSVAACKETKDNKDNKDKTESPAPPAGSGPDCDAEFDKTKFQDKYTACQDCQKQHRGMGSMEADCKNAIAKPWK